MFRRDPAGVAVAPLLRWRTSGLAERPKRRIRAGWLYPWATNHELDAVKRASTMGRRLFWSVLPVKASRRSADEFVAAVRTYLHDKGLA